MPQINLPSTSAGNNTSTTPATSASANNTSVNGGSTTVNNSNNPTASTLTNTPNSISTNNIQATTAKKNKYDDPNEIKVIISNKNIPIVILFGPPSCGKTMLLIRLTRYLKSIGYSIKPIKTFRPADDDNYQNLCDKFDSLVNDDDAAKSTSLIDFMLIEVLDKRGKSLCQILEGPGELYFDPLFPDKEYPAYINTITSCSNRKIWNIFVEPDWMNDVDRRNYVLRIEKLLKGRMDKSKDKTIFVCNKIDQSNYVISRGKVNLSAARKHIMDLYPDIFNSFKNDNPISRFFREWKCDFIPFQTGYFTQSNRGLTYQEGPKEYPAMLWNKIHKLIKG